MTDRSRREKKSKAQILEEYKRARDGGPRVLKVSKPFTLTEHIPIHKRVQEEDVDIYDEVTEDQYKSIVKGRLQRDDFVEDDGAEGYVDNGMDDWGGGEEEDDYSEEEEDRKKS